MYLAVLALLSAGNWGQKQSYSASKQAANVVSNMAASMLNHSDLYKTLYGLVWDMEGEKIWALATLNKEFMIY